MTIEAASPCAARAKELGSFLRFRRDSADPAAYGLSGNGRRRAPGLRREEVATLAGVSVSWYTFLEQGRDIHISEQVAMSLARVFRLTDVEQSYLLSLIGDPALPQALPLVAKPEHLALLDMAGDHPAYLANLRYDILASNHSFKTLFPTIATQSQGEQNLLRSAFLDPEARSRLVHWEEDVSLLVAQFRAAAQGRLFSVDFAPLVTDLLKQSDEFRAMWERRDIILFANAKCSYRDKAVGEFTLSYTKLSFADNSGVSFILQTAEPGSPFWQLLNQTNTTERAS